MAVQNTHPEDYISVPGFRQTITDIFKALLELLFFTGNALKRHILVFLLVVAGALGIGFYLYLKVPRIYKYDMLVECNSMTRKAYIQMFNQLNNVLGQGGDSALAAELNVSRNVAVNIMMFEVEALDGQAPTNDSTRKSGGFLRISVSMGTAIQPAELQNAVLNYVNNRPYLKKVKEMQMEVYRVKMDFINRNLAKLDSLKDAYNRFVGSGRMANTLYSSVFDPANVYTRSSELMGQKIDLMHWMSMEEQSLTIVDGFKQINRPVYVSMSKFLIIPGFVGFLVGIFICLLLEINKKL